MSFRIVFRPLQLISISSLSKTISRNQFRPAQSLVSNAGTENRAAFSSKPSSNILYEKDPETGELKKKKTTIIPKITLLSGHDVSITTMEEAQKLAKRRDLKLVKIIDLDTKTQRPVYKLMSGTEYLEEDLKQKQRKKLQKQNSAIKGEKMLMLSQNISEHDLDIHINKIVKWLSKRFEVRMVINGSNESMSKAENVFASIEKKLKPHNSRILDKRIKGSDIRFTILPPKEVKNSTESINSPVSASTIETASTANFSTSSRSGATANLSTSSGSENSLSNNSGSGGKNL